MSLKFIADRCTKSLAIYKLIFQGISNEMIDDMAAVRSGVDLTSIKSNHQGGISRQSLTQLGMVENQSD